MSSMEHERDPYTALWVSHSSINDYLICPRAYYLKNVYRDPETRQKIALVQPALALGQAVHDVLESLAVLPVAERRLDALVDTYVETWEKVRGRKGGFKDIQEERQYFERGVAMVERVVRNPGPILEKAVRIRQELPHYWLSEEEEIILCGRIDWLSYREDDDSVHIIDFKTGKHEERTGSLQLPIYYLIVRNCQKRKVAQASYWYLDSSDDLTEVALPDEEEAKQQVLDVAMSIKSIRAANYYRCVHGGCSACEPYEAILNGEAECIGSGEFGRVLYVLP